MPLIRHAKYLVRFELPDGEHVATLSSVAVTDEASARFVTNAATQAIGQNPDAKLIDIEPLKGGLEQIKQAVQRLRDENPDRPLASDLGVEPNRILAEPNIARGLAALYRPSAVPATSLSPEQDRAPSIPLPEAAPVPGSEAASAAVAAMETPNVEPGRVPG